MTTTTRTEILVGLHIRDESQYTSYRAGMTPILKDFGGYFRFDYRVSDMLIGEAEDPHNRVFVLSFPDESSMKSFFENEQYKVVRAEHFDPAVQSVGILATYTAQIPGSS